MARTTDSAVHEFIDEVLDILSGIEDAEQGAANLDGEHTYLERLELGLHTIKSNSRYFGYEEYAEIAGQLLSLVREIVSSDLSTISLQQPEREAFIEFVDKSRRYMEQLRVGDREGGLSTLSRFFNRVLGNTEILAPLDSLDPCDDNEVEEVTFTVADERARVEEEASASDSSQPPPPAWREEIKNILTTAPEVFPDLECLASIARGETLVEQAESVANSGSVSKVVAEERTAEGPSEEPLPQRVDRPAHDSVDEDCSDDPALKKTVAMEALSIDDESEPMAPSADSDAGEPHPVEIPPQVPRRAPVRRSRCQPPLTVSSDDSRESEIVTSIDAPPSKLLVSPTTDLSSGVRETLAVTVETFQKTKDSLAKAGREDSDAGTRGFGFEALRALDILDRACEERRLEPEMGEAIARVSELLQTFGLWSTGSRYRPLEEIVREAASWCAEFSATLGTRLQWEVDSSGAEVAAPVGDLVKSVLSELLGALVPPKSRGVARSKFARFEVEVEDDHVIVHVDGLRTFQQTGDRLRVYSLRERIEELGARLIEDRTRDRVTVQVPCDYSSVDVVVVQSGETRVGIPRHRVDSIGTWSGDVSTQPDGDAEIEFEGERVRALDLTGWAGDESGGQAEKSVVWMRTSSDRFAVLVDAVIGERTMLVSLLSSVQPESDVIGFCVSPEDGRRMPVVCPCVH